MSDCSANASVSRSSAGTRPKSSSTAGRSSTARRRTSWRALTTCSRSSARAARAGWSASASSSGFSPSRIEVSACPVSSWSSRASRWRSSSCACTTRRTASRATRCDSSTATAARAANVSASRKSSSVKRGSGPSLSWISSTPIAWSRAISGTHMPVRAASCRETSWCTSGSSSTESMRSLRRRSSTAPLFDPEREIVVPSSPSAPATAANRRVVAAARQRERDDPRAEQLAQAADDEVEQPLEIGLGRERVADLVQRLRAGATSGSTPRRGARSRSPPPPGRRGA